MQRFLATYNEMSQCGVGITTHAPLHGYNQNAMFAETVQDELGFCPISAPFARPGDFRPNHRKTTEAVGRLRRGGVMLESISLAAGLSWAAGLRLYLTVLLAGVCASFGLIHLPSALQGLASPWLIATALVFALIEFFADKIPAFDSLWDAVHTLIRIPAGGLLAAGALGHADPKVVFAVALSGSVLAGAAHLTKAGARAIINLSSERASGRIASVAEELLVIGGLALAFCAPLVFLALLAAFLLLAIWALPRLWRGIQGGWRGMALHMVHSTVQPVSSLRSLRGKRD